MALKRLCENTIVLGQILVPTTDCHLCGKLELARETLRLVVITSGKGGIGKKTTAANVGLSLARLRFFVVAIDTDVGLRNLDLLLGLENRVNYTIAEVLNDRNSPIGFSGKALVWLVDALKACEDRSLDFILIDYLTGIGARFITGIAPANDMVLVMMQIEWQGWFIPKDSKVIMSTYRGYSLVLNKSPNLARLAFEQAAWKLVEHDNIKQFLSKLPRKSRKPDSLELARSNSCTVTGPPHNLADPTVLIQVLDIPVLQNGHR
ncbi:hypothetical protein V6N11_059082 [Hibiscus sabdariffa]|uniref:CobQ/CobB/MinD/ParA nucleotide binding domain-containing protein n=1 Tax=Hibiscus sabdariffa TaxID=183260 RepID=A0ABR2U632_9ROSI